MKGPSLLSEYVNVTSPLVALAVGAIVSPSLNSVGKSNVIVLGVPIILNDLTTASAL